MIWKDSFLTRFIYSMRITIRSSILSIVLILLFSISSLIVAINYNALDSVLIAVAKNYLGYATSAVSKHISAYFQPLDDNLLTAYRMLNTGVVKPKKLEESVGFLYSLVADDNNINAAFWGDVSGNLHIINKEVNDNFLLEQADLYNNKITARFLNSRGQTLFVKERSFDGVDPRTRPWYKQAQLAKKPVWVIYKFLKIGEQKEQLGVTAACPLYDSTGKLLGVFGVDMLIGYISKYIHGVKITNNSSVLLIDKGGNIISGLNIGEDLSNREEMLNIDSLHEPWIREILKFCLQNYQSPRTYLSSKNRYVFSYARIENIRAEEQWLVVIITPVDDIVAPLRRDVLIALFFISIALLVGIILGSILSSNISRSIRKLAEDANLICQLKLVEVKTRFSQIIEVAEMQESFMKMKNVLRSVQRYMPILLVKKLIASNKVATVGGETKELTVMFTDIQAFTQTFENIDPQAVMEYLSRYFQVITKAIIETNGTVDKYLGDGMMAFWGAPTDDTEHALHACRAALQIQLVLQQLNEEFASEDKPQVVTRIGVNTGNMVVGNVGSDDRLNYTLLGDSVNLGSRLESLNKVYGTMVIVSEFTYDQVKDKFKFRLIDKVVAQGKKHWIYVHELLGNLEKEPDLKLEQYNHEFLIAFSCYERGDWQIAINLFNELGKKYPKDQVVQMLIKRCVILSQNPPANWDGVWVMTEK